MTSKKKTILIIVCCIVVILAAAAFFIFKTNTLSDSEKQALLETGRFQDGTYVDNIDISGMTFEQAQNALEASEDKLLKDAVITLVRDDVKFELNAENMGMSIDTQEVLKQALYGPEEQSMFQKWSSKNDAKYSINSSINEEKVAETLIAAQAALEQQPQDAQVKVEERGISIIEEKTGISIDAEKLSETVWEKIQNKDYSEVQVEYDIAQPEVTKADLEKITVKRGGYSTSFAKSPYNNKNRVANIEKCVEKIRAASKVETGAEFKINDVLGPRTEAGGWKLAPGYVRGRSEDQPGGGVCQMSSTLYCALLTSDIEITSRINHSIPVGYAKMGLDATISTGGPDLNFRNNTGNPIYIVCWTDNYELFVDIYGEPFSGFDEIRLSSEKVKNIEPSGEMKITVDPTKPVGYYEQYVKRRTGSLWKSYKTYYLNGNKVDTQFVANSTYKAYAGEVIVGPEAAKEPDTDVPAGGTTPEASKPAATTTPTPAE